MHCLKKIFCSLNLIFTLTLSFGIRTNNLQKVLLSSPIIEICAIDSDVLVEII